MNKIGFDQGISIRDKEEIKIFCVKFATPLIKRERKGKILMFLKNGPSIWKIIGKVIDLSKKSIKIQFKDPIHNRNQEVELVI